MGPRAVRAVKEGTDDQVDGLWVRLADGWIHEWMIKGEKLFGRNGLLPGVPFCLEILDVFGEGF